MNISPRAFRRTATVAVACYALLVVTGAAVRLTGSGLGCLDWPMCSAQHLVAADSFHPLVEFSNRCVTVAVTIVSIATFLAAMFRVPRRRDLSWCAFGLVGGVAAQIVLGGIVVLTKLNPYLVSLHFLLTLVILGDALVLRHRAGHSGVRGAPLIGATLLWLARLLVATMTVLVTVGSVVTGAGPHAGGKGTKRIPIAFSTIAESHSDIALFLIGMTLAMLFALHQTNAPSDIQHRARIVLEVLACQGALGFTQYFLHDNALVVEFHVAGATAAWCALVSFYLALHHVKPEPLAPRASLAATRTDAGLGALHEIGTLIAMVDVETVTIDKPITDETVSEDRPWLVIVWNDPVNLMSYVTFVFQKLFGYSKEKATKLMLDVHYKGRAVVSSGTRERAEVDVARLHHHGLWATMEQAQ